MAPAEKNETNDLAEQGADRGEKRGEVRTTGTANERRDHAATAETGNQDSSGGGGEAGGSAGGTGGGETLVQP